MSRAVQPPEWTTRAACITYDPDLFFPAPSDRYQIKTAKAICRACPVRTECLDSALATETDGRGGRHGIWGGTTPDERARIARRRKV